MKVNIGPYKEYFTTHGLKCDYLEWAYGDDWFKVKPEDYIWNDRIVAGVLDCIQAVILNPINKFRKRKVKIKYDKYDTWSLDHTLALIILPGLKQLKATNHGHPSVDYSDLPYDWLKDASREDQWEWIMDEMIWAFNEITNDYPGEEIFHIGDTDLSWTNVNAQGEEDPEGSYLRMDLGPDHNRRVDFEGRKAYDDRIHNGLMLFGKYYRNLWD
jgi:hypothetical protein